MASTFTKTTENGGISIAQSSRWGHPQDWLFYVPWRAGWPLVDHWFEEQHEAWAFVIAHSRQAQLKSARTYDVHQPRKLCPLSPVAGAEAGKPTAPTRVKIKCCRERRNAFQQPSNPWPPRCSEPPKFFPSTSWGVSASVSTFGGAAGVSASAGASGAQVCAVPLASLLYRMKAGQYEIRNLL